MAKKKTTPNASAFCEAVEKSDVETSCKPGLLQSNIAPFIWVHTNSGVDIREGSPQEKRLQASGIKGPLRGDKLP